MPGKTRSSSPVELVALAEAREGLGDDGRERDRPDLAGLRRRQRALGVARGHADVSAREVDVAPAQCDELAAAQAGEGGGEVDRGVLLGRGGADERHDVLGREDVDVGAVRLDRLLDVA